MTDSVLVTEHPAGDWVIGQLTLNVEKTLNSLTREMVEIITDRLEAWADDDKVVAVFIDGAGEKAFCAGGDVQVDAAECELAVAVGVDAPELHCLRPLAPCSSGKGGGHADERSPTRNGSQSASLAGCAERAGGAGAEQVEPMGIDAEPGSFRGGGQRLVE